MYFNLVFFIGNGEFFLSFLQLVYVIFSIDGVRTLTHFDAAVYTARRLEMLRIADATLFYLVKRPVVHSELSGLPFMVRSISNFWINLFNFNLR